MKMEEEALLADVNLDEPWALVESFSKFKREHPDDVNRGMDEVIQRLRSNGVQVTVHEPELFLSLPGDAWIETDDGRIRAKPPAFSVPAPEGLSGKLVYVSANQADNIDTIFEKKIDPTSNVRQIVEGNIVVSEGFASPGMISQFEDLGAIGVVGINPGEDIHWGICTTIWGTPDLDDLPRKPTVVAVAVNRTDGDRLIEIARAGGEVKLFANMQEGWFKSKIPEVKIAGSIEPEKFVLLHGHLDSWDVGVGDNATGNATLLECARVLDKHKDLLRRSVRVLWWPGHSTGRYAGSTWYADQFAIDLDDNCVAQVNCDSPGCRWATEFTNLSVMSEAKDFVEQVVREVADKSIEPERPHRAGDYSFNNIGISSYFMLSSTMTPEHRNEMGYYAVGGCGANIAWHTENDTLEIADKENLQRDIKVYLAAVWKNASQEVLPFDWRLTVEEFRETVSVYNMCAAGRFDLAQVDVAIQGLMRSLNSFYDAVELKKLSVHSANDVIVDLARILVPINFTREVRFRHDPALSVPALPSIALARDLDSIPAEKMGFALTQLLRGRNRLVSALNQARKRVDQSMK